MEPLYPSSIISCHKGTARLNTKRHLMWFCRDLGHMEPRKCLRPSSDPLGIRNQEKRADCLCFSYLCIWVGTLQTISSDNVLAKLSFCVCSQAVSPCFGNWFYIMAFFSCLFFYVRRCQSRGCYLKVFIFCCVLALKLFVGIEYDVF